MVHRLGAYWLALICCSVIRWPLRGVTYDDRHSSTHRNREIPQRCVALADWVVGIYPEGSLRANFCGEAIWVTIPRGVQCLFGISASVASGGSCERRVTPIQ